MFKCHKDLERKIAGQIIAQAKNCTAQKISGMITDIARAKALRKALLNLQKIAEQLTIKENERSWLKALVASLATPEHMQLKLCGADTFEYNHGFRMDVTEFSIRQAAVSGNEPGAGMSSKKKVRDDAHKDSDACLRRTSIRPQIARASTSSRRMRSSLRKSISLSNKMI